jgi:hypothetical protein
VRTLAVVTLALAGCAHDPPPPPSAPAPGGVVAGGPRPSTAVLHLSLAGDALRAAIDQQIPQSPSGDFTLHGIKLRASLSREPVDLHFENDRVVLHTTGTISVFGPVTGYNHKIPIDLTVRAAPVVASDYQVRLQDVDVDLHPTNPLLEKAAEVVGGLRWVDGLMRGKLGEVTYDLRPLLAQGATWANTPVKLPIDDKSCVRARVSAVMAGPTILAGGFEKNLALVIAPSVYVEGATPTGQCDPTTPPPPLPLLQNVEALQPGPFTVELPIDLDYGVVSREFGKRFIPAGGLRATPDHDLFLDQPRVYPSSGKMVIAMHLSGKVGRYQENGEIYLAGNPSAENGRFTVPDLAVTVESKDYLLKLANVVMSDDMAKSASAQMDFDLRPTIDSITANLTRRFPVENLGCLIAGVDHVDVLGFEFHDASMRVRLAVTAHAEMDAPCPQ